VKFGHGRGLLGGGLVCCNDDLSLCVIDFVCFLNGKIKMLTVACEIGGSVFDRIKLPVTKNKKQKRNTMMKGKDDVGSAFQISVIACRRTPKTN